MSEIIDPNAPVVHAEAPAPAEPPKERSNKEKVGDSFTAIFIDKLKEQSFTILIMLLALYYQHNLWMAEREALSKEVDQKEERILQVVERERDKSIDREPHGSRVSASASAAAREARAGGGGTEWSAEDGPHPDCHRQAGSEAAPEEVSEVRHHSGSPSRGHGDRA